VSEPFVAEIRIMACPFPPVGWAWCDGQIMSIQQNTALFALLGTTYGGNGTVTFALPNLQGRAPMHQGQGPGLTDHFIGEEGGEVTVTLTAIDTPTHNHGLAVSRGTATELAPSGQQFATGVNVQAYATPGQLGFMSAQALTPYGGSQPHNNMQPYLALYFNIALQGLFPQRQ
jgi:microcystin-dependent protein